MEGGEHGKYHRKKRRTRWTAEELVLRETGILSGLWKKTCGENISDQGVFRLSVVNKTMLTEYGNQMGYSIKEGNTALTKLINFTENVGDSYEE